MVAAQLLKRLFRCAIDHNGNLCEPCTFLKKLDAKQQEVLRIHREHMNRHATDRRHADKARAIELEMLRPKIDPRMKQADELA